MKACCCAPRIGSFVGLSCALVFRLGLGFFFWSGGSDNFNTRAAERANRFCSYPTDITHDYRQPSVCSNEADPCICHDAGANCTADEFLVQVTSGQGFGGTLGSGLILLFLAVVVGFVGVGMKTSLVTKCSAATIALCLVLFTIVWIGFWTRSSSYREVEGVGYQYWAFWKTMQCNDTATPDTMVWSMADLKSRGVEPVHAMDDADYGPMVLNPLWCATAPIPGGWRSWQRADKNGPADTEDECPDLVAGNYSLTFILFFVFTWILAVPLHAWLVAAMWQTANEKANAYPPSK